MATSKFSISQFALHSKLHEIKMAALTSLAQYFSDSDSSTDDDGSNHESVDINEETTKSVISKLPLTSAPEVVTKDDVHLTNPVGINVKEVSYNPTYEQLFSPLVGPSNPFKSEHQKAKKNTLAGYVEPANVNDFHFETQRRTFRSYGYALDPTVDGSEEEGKRVVGSTETADENNALTVFEASKKRLGDKRKREKNTDASDIDGFLGPWGKFTDEQTVAAPTEEDKEYIEEFLAKKKKRGKRTEPTPVEEKTTLHIKDTHDYLGRSFLHIPQDLGINLKSDEPPDKCFIPKKQIHTWAGHSKGISAIRWFPKSAHLMLSSSMDSKIKIWEVFNQRRCIRTYIGHRQAVRDICFNNDGHQFISAGYDRFLKLWDTEKGTCISKFTSKKVPYCVKFNPEEDKQHLFIAGTSDKKIVCWDTRSGDVVQEYDRHLGAVNTITFVDDNRRFVSTSDDKSMRVWEWDIPVDMKYIAEPTMHSMPAVTLAPNGKWLACQSMDNKVMIFSAMNRFKFNRKKSFKGHMVAGYACSLDFSPDMSYLVSGDADGKVYIWDWKTTRIFSRWKAHDNVCIGVLWHPHETSKLATAGWDGVIKYWD